ncbi:hypothetical protein CC78DRAFT_580015 [Lojkania enalia]|uniref:Uncharacterized protein n=1 Tax=Lojkania enalia TaxID=147567 RepID=A0A9P4K9Y0_9PLEO|nr:hypothetical protein CC78DRAFT_580015 [Didymosphaeria enalia]
MTKTHLALLPLLISAAYAQPAHIRQCTFQGHQKQICAPISNSSLNFFNIPAIYDENGNVIIDIRDQHPANEHNSMVSLSQPWKIRIPDAVQPLNVQNLDVQAQQWGKDTTMSIRVRESRGEKRNEGILEFRYGRLYWTSDDTAMRGTHCSVEEWDMGSLSCGKGSRNRRMDCPTEASPNNSLNPQYPNRQTRVSIPRQGQFALIFWP